MSEQHIVKDGWLMRWSDKEVCYVRYMPVEEWEFRGAALKEVSELAKTDLPAAKALLVKKQAEIRKMAKNREGTK
jgi:hypothetical protein